MVQGIGIATNPIKTNFPGKNMEYILRKSMQVKKYSGQGFFSESHLIPFSKKDILKYMKANKNKVQEAITTQFVITDPNYKNDQIVYNYFQNKKANVLDSSLDSLTCLKVDKDLSVFKKIIFGVLGAVQLVLWPLNIIVSKEPWIKGVEIGTENYELGILNGKVLTAIGDLVYDFKNNSISIENSLFVMKDKRDIVEYLASQIDNLSSKLNYSVFVAMGIGSYIGYCFYLYNKQKLRYKRDSEFNHLKNIEETEEEIGDDMKCIICIDKPRSVILKPCMHTLMCRTCLKTVMQQNQQCPICKEKIEDYIEILIDEEQY